MSIPVMIGIAIAGKTNEMEMARGVGKQSPGSFGVALYWRCCDFDPVNNLARPRVPFFDRRRSAPER